MAADPELLEKFIQLSERAYNSVYTAFSQTATLELAEPKPAVADKAFSARVAEGQVNSIEVKGALRIDKLPYKRRETARTPNEDDRHNPGINVLLNSLDVYKFDLKKPALKNSFLYKSEVRVAYFKEKRGQWKPHLCIRYDFAHSYGSHPIFHAQFEDGMPSDDVLQTFGNLPEVVQPLNAYVHVRMPTANVVGATALLSLAADHLAMDKFPDVLNAVRDQTLFKADPWRCDYSSLDDGKMPMSMLASRWYSGKQKAA